MGTIIHIISQWVEGIPWSQIREDLKEKQTEKQKISKLFANIRKGIHKPEPVNRLRATTCKHEHVKIRYVQPVTLFPKEGVCKDCGKKVKAKLVWE